MGRRGLITTPAGSVRVVEVGPRDDAAFDRWFHVMDVVLEHDRPGEPRWSWQEQRAIVVHQQRPDTSVLAVLLEAVDDSGATVGHARLDLPLADNVQQCSAEVLVLPQARRRGAGSALLAECVRRARAQRRRAMALTVDEPEHLAGTSPGRAFATQAGAELEMVEVRRDLALPADPQRLAALAADAERRSAGYRVVEWGDRVPDAFAEDVAGLHAQISVDAPHGEFDLEPEAWDIARLRRVEDLVVAQGRARLGSGAVHEATGRVVAFTELTVSLSTPERAYQWETLVERAHRGHRLGALVKIATLARLTERSPRTTGLVTWNADTNDPMIAVNEAMGFVPAGNDVVWQLRL